MQHVLQAIYSGARANKWAILVFLTAFSYFTVLCAPDLTWANTGSDGSTYLRSAEYLTISHPMGAPLYNLMNWLVVQIPIGLVFWRLAMVSVIASSITALLLYLIARRYTASWKALIAPGIWLASGLVVSQSIIVETYALVSMLMVGAYWLHLRGNNISKYLVCAAGIAVHHLVLFVLAVILVQDIVRARKAKQRLLRPVYLLPLLGLLPYLYIPLVNGPPYYWIEGNGFGHYISYFFSQGGLIGGIAVIESDMLLRIQDFTAIIGLSLGLGLLLIIPAMLKRENIALTLLFLMPIAYYITDLAPQTYVYMMPSIAFGGLLAVKGASLSTARLPFSSSLGRWVPATILLSCLGLIAFNIQTFDIGRTLDKEQIARGFYNSLAELPQDGTIWIEHGGWWQATIWLYNSDTEAELVALPIYGEGKEWNVAQAETALAEGKLYKLVITDPTSAGSEFALATAEDIDYLEETAEGLHPYEEGAVKTSWVSPVSLITGQAEIERWSKANMSNINAGLIMVFAFWGITSAVVTDKALPKTVTKKKRLIASYMVMGLGIVILVGVFSLMGMEVNLP